jgi:competence protein ComEA
MNRLKALLRSVFGFSRTESNAFLILLPLMAVLIFSEPIYRYFTVHKKNDFSKEKIQLDSITSQWHFENLQDSRTITTQDKFKFDPNTSTEEELLALGFPGNLANRIINYRAKKGKFIIKSDLNKIYGMDSALFAELVPFIELPDKKTYVTEKEKIKVESRAKLEVPQFDLNLADTNQLKTIYGIGPVLAKRIVEYRSKLGGFIAARQLNEVYGLDSVVINQLNKKSFISENYSVNQININTANEKTLAAHPYITFKLAKAIVVYRFQHGNFKLIDDLTPIQSISPETIAKLKPYITF